MDGTTAVVTGASRGIGASVVRCFADEGAHVVACARDHEAVEAVVSETEGATTAMRADVRDEFDVERLMERAAGEGGAIDVVVANAGVYHGRPGETPLVDESYAAFDDHLRTNGRGVFATIREAIPHLATDARVIVPSGQVASDQPSGYGSYAVSKATAEAIARGFAADVDQPVAVVDPGQVATELTGGTGRDPDEAAEMIRWVATGADADAIDGTRVTVADWRDAVG